SDSERHETARKGLESLDNGSVSSVVVEELAHALTRLGIDKATIDAKIRETMETYEVLSISERNITDASTIIMNERGTSFKRFNDKLILSVAKERGAALLTFDNDLAKECRENGVKLHNE
ncbi:MAG: PIN domain-containing protein, partial [Candidatus Micrarchaeaceae archaeon]